MKCGPRENLHADSRCSPPEPLFLCHSQHRRRGAAGRSRRPARALPEHRRPGGLRVQHAAAPDCRGRAGDARRTQWVWAFARHRLGTRGSRRGIHVTRVSRHAGSHIPHGGDLRRHRARAQRAGRRRHRCPGAAADLSPLHRHHRQARRAGAVLSNRSRPRLDAGSRSSPRRRDAGDARDRHHRSQ